MCEPNAVGLTRPCQTANATAWRLHGASMPPTLNCHQPDSAAIATFGCRQDSFAIDGCPVRFNFGKQPVDGANIGLLVEAPEPLGWSEPSSGPHCALSTALSVLAGLTINLGHMSLDTSNALHTTAQLVAALSVGIGPALSVPLFNRASPHPLLRNRPDGGGNGRPCMVTRIKDHGQQNAHRRQPTRGNPRCGGPRHTH
jgi:hypothetical protein